ncbi:hypothetical protein J3R83DRAFT_6950 [Lanmaoa asiatica]|nr:hypothetical protein J3R83DRAFT_6950 [Lanmaoa asiatica]
MTILPASRFYTNLALSKCSLPIPRKGYVTAGDVTEGKPKPGPYIAGAVTLGISPEKCLVIEDAPSGLKAGHAAGARTLAVCTSHQPETLVKEADGNLDHIVLDLERCASLNIETKPPTVNPLGPICIGSRSAWWKIS